MVYNTSNSKNIIIASQLILNGKIIIYSTDTLYGFGVDATNHEAITKLNHIKERIKPYSVIVNSIKMLKKYAIINNKIEKMLNNMLPGPFTAILKKENNNLSPLVSLDLSTIGIRIPDNNFILNVVSNIKRPIITTSINVHGRKPINKLPIIIKKYSNFNIFTDMKNRESKGSTIINFTTSPYKIIREGDKSINI